MCSDKSKRPFFSIIVVSLNAEDSIAETVNSVLGQNFDDYEIIIKDGFSKDNTLKNIPEDDKIKIYQKADTGIYDAMNQGIDLAQGKFLCFLNCGDYFENESVLKNVYSIAQDAEKKCIIYGNYQRKGVVFKVPRRLTPFYLYKTTLCHQSMFVSKKAFEIHGKYKTNYKIFADYEHVLCSFFSGAQYLYCNHVICDYRGGGFSESKEVIAYKEKERNEVRNNYFSEKNRKKYEFILRLSFRKLRQKMISDNAPAYVRILYRKIVNIINR